MPDFARDDWRFIPTEAVDAEQRQDDAGNWATDQRAKLAQRWADAQRAAAPPPPPQTPPIRDDWSTSPQPTPPPQGTDSFTGGNTPATPVPAQFPPQTTTGQDTRDLRASGGNTYVVQPGDNLSTIAQRYGMKWMDLYAANRNVIGDKPDLIQPGMRFSIPSGAGRPQLDAGPGAPTAYQTPIGAGQGQIPDWLSGAIRNAAPDDLANDPNFIRSVAAGAKAESGWDPRAVQPNGGGRGLFQFDVAGGMGRGVPEDQLYDVGWQASRIVPKYADAYRDGQRQGLSGAELASYTAAMAERPSGYGDPNSAARQNYRAAYAAITSSEQARDVTSGGYPGQQPYQPPTPAAQGNTWQDVANQQLGKPYIWGSAGGRSDFSDTARGFDCSGFVSYVMQKGLGIPLPAQTASAYQATQPIDEKDAKPGDVVLYNMGDNDPHIQHIAIYLGNGQVIQAGGGGGRHDVNIAPIDNAGSYEFRRPVGRADADQSKTQIANVANSAAPDSARSDTLQHSDVDAASNWIPGLNPTAPVTAPLVAPGATGSRAQPDFSPGGVLGAIGQKASDLKDAVQNAGRGFVGGAQDIGRNAQQLASGGLPDITGLLSPAAIPGGAESPLGRAAQGQQLSGPEQLAAGGQAFLGSQQAGARAMSAINPLRDVPVVGAIIDQAATPAFWLGGFGKGAAGAASMVGATDVAERLIDPNDPNRGIKLLAAGLIGGVGVQKLADAGAPVFGRAIEAAMQNAPADVQRVFSTLGGATRQPGENALDAGLRILPDVQKTLEASPTFQQASAADQSALRSSVQKALNDQLVSQAQPEGAMGFPSRGAQLASREARDQAIQAAQRGFGLNPDEVAPAGGVLRPALAEDQANVTRQLDQQTARDYPGIFGEQAQPVPSGVKPTVRIPASQVPTSEAAQAIRRLDSGDESALDDLARLDKQQSSAEPTTTSTAQPVVQPAAPAANTPAAATATVRPAAPDLLDQLLREKYQWQGGGAPAAATATAAKPPAGAAGEEGGSLARPIDVRPPAAPVTPAEQQADALLRQYAPDMFTDEGLQRLTRGTGPTPTAPATPPPGISGPTELAAGLSPAAVGRAAEPIGRFVASALSPTENLDPAVRQVVEQYANMVGRNSDAASVIANNYLRQIPPAQRSQPGVAAAIQQQVRQTLRDGATKNLVADLETQGLAAKIGTYRPAGWKLVSDVPGSPLANYAFDPSVVGPLKAVTAASAIAANPVGNAILKTTGTAKQTIFSLSNFHTVTEGINAAFSSPETLKNYAFAFASNDFAQGLRGSMASTLADAARSGVTGLVQRAGPDVEGQIGNLLWRRVVSGGVSGIGGAAAGYTETKIAGGSEDDARRNALILGLSGAALGGVPALRGKTVAETLQSALWDRAVPLAKVTAWKGLVDGGLDKATAARVINERFGGLNYAAMGRDPTLMDATRLLAMAPDWNESTIRQLGSAIFGGSGQGVRAGFIAKTIGGMMAATEVANYALSGHSTLSNQPGHQFEIEVTDPKGGYMHVGILPGNLQAWLNLANKEYSDPSRRVTAPVNFVTGRLAAAPQMAGETYQTVTAGNRRYSLPYDVSKAGPVGILSRLSPIGESQVIQGVEKGGLNPLVAGAMAAAGLNPRYDKSEPA